MNPAPDPGWPSLIGAGEAGHPALALFPLLAAVIASAFGLDLVRRYVRRRRPSEGMWAVAVLMYAAASAAMFAGVLFGWDAATFRVYYLLGAVLNVPYLFVGEAYLLTRRRAVGHALLALLFVATAFAAWKVSVAPVHEGPLAQVLPLGREVFGAGSLPHRLAQYYVFPAYFLLLGGLVWSAWQMRDRPALRDRAAGVLLIALGATVVAIGSGVGAGLYRLVPLFSVSLAAGIAVMFWGFVRAARPGRTVPA